MLKQLIYAGMFLLFLGHLQGKAIDEPTLLPATPFESQTTLTTPMNLPVPLVSMWSNLATTIQTNMPNHAYLDVFQMIQGKMAGVRVSGNLNNYKVRLRNATRPPLFVIDGMPLMGFSDACINNFVLSILPTEVESIRITKGIRGAIVYGAAARSGLIEIQTLPMEAEVE